MLTEHAIVTDRELWVVADGQPGVLWNGTKDSPLRLSGTLDALAPVIGQRARVHFAPGEYLTRGFALPKTVIWDAPDGDVTIKLRDNATDGLGYPHVRLVTDNGKWCDFVSLDGITFDGNWENQAGSQSGNFKIEPVVINTLQGRVSNCTVRNFGSSARDYGKLGLEAFPLSLATVANGDPQFYDLRYAAIQELHPTRLEILDNLVELPHFAGGGYCTGIAVRTNVGMDAGDRQPMGTRTTQAALVRGNRVNVPGGICYGCAHVEQSVFERNWGTGKCAFVLDTGRGLSVTVRQNVFQDVSQGPIIAPSGNGERIAVDDNLIMLGAPFWNAVLAVFEPQWGIKGRFITSSSANRNTIMTPAGWFGIALDGIAGDANGISTINGTAVDVAPLRIEIETLKEAVASRDISISKLRQKIAAAATMLDTAQTTLINSLS